MKILSAINKMFNRSINNKINERYNSKNEKNLAEERKKQEVIDIYKYDREHTYTVSEFELRKRYTPYYIKEIKNIVIGEDQKYIFSVYEAGIKSGSYFYHRPDGYYGSKATLYIDDKDQLTICIERERRGLIERENIKIPFIDKIYLPIHKDSFNNTDSQFIEYDLFEIHNDSGKRVIVTRDKDSFIITRN